MSYRGRPRAARQRMLIPEAFARTVRVHALPFYEHMIAATLDAQTPGPLCANVQVVSSWFRMTLPTNLGKAPGSVATRTSSSGARQISQCRGGTASRGLAGHQRHRRDRGAHCAMTMLRDVNLRLWAWVDKHYQQWPIPR